MTTEAIEWKPGARDNPEQVYQGIEIAECDIPRLLQLSKRIKGFHALLPQFDHSIAVRVGEYLPLVLMGNYLNNGNGIAEGFLPHQDRIYPVWALKEVALLEQRLPQVFKPEDSKKG